MCYIIASHMLKRSIENIRARTIQLCVQVFLHCIAVFDRIAVHHKITVKVSNNYKVDLTENAKDVVRQVELYNRWDTEMKIILDVRRFAIRILIQVKSSGLDSHPILISLKIFIVMQKYFILIYLTILL